MGWGRGEDPVTSRVPKHMFRALDYGGRYHVNVFEKNISGKNFLRVRGAIAFDIYCRVTFKQKGYKMSYLIVF